MLSLLQLGIAQITRFGGILTRIEESVKHLCILAVEETPTTSLARISVNQCARDKVRASFHRRNCVWLMVMICLKLIS